MQHGRDIDMSSLKQTARLTGLFYLGLAITGMAGFLVVRPALHDPMDGAASVANLVDKEWLARTGVALELGVVLTQALVAVWFFKLFRSVDSFAAGCIAVFGMVNAVAILASATVLSTALSVALDPSIAPGGDAAATVQLMYAISQASWAGGNLFFGLWLIPMGYAVVVSGWMPRLLGYVLVVGGVGYTLAGFAVVLLPAAPEMAEAVLTIPATIGELWIIGYLLVFGVRSTAEELLAASTTA